MIEAIHTESAWVWDVLGIGVDVALKATCLLLLAIIGDRVLPRGRVLVRTAAWNACLIGLLLLPVITAAFPRLRVQCLPARSAPVEPEIVSASVAEVTDVSSPNRPAEAARYLLSVAVDLYEQTVVTPGSWTVVSDSGHDSGGTVETSTADVAVAPPLSEDTSAASIESDKFAGATGFPWALLAACVYAGGVVLLAVRLAMSLRAVRMLRRSGLRLTDSDWLDAVDRWRDRLGIRKTVAMVRTDRVSVPTALGWVRPMILLPVSLAGARAAGHRDAILVHELAHVRRRDYLWQLILRVVQVIYWPHPLTWVMGRLVAGARERACDALCVHYLQNPQSYRATLVEVAAKLLDPASIRPEPLSTPMARSARLTRRLRRIDGKSRVTRCLAGWPVRTVIAALAVVVVGVIAPIELARRSAEAKEAAAPTPPTTKTDPDAHARTLDFHVLHAETRQPLPGVALKIWLNDDKEKHVTDEQGRYRIKLPAAKLKTFCVRASAPGFVPLQVTFRCPHVHLDIPERYTLKLPPGTSIGGVVRDESGKPIQGATVKIWLSGQDHAMRAVLFDRDDPLKTDAQGRWRCDGMPADFEDVRVDVWHLDFVEDERRWRRQPPRPETLRDMSHVTVLKRGITIEVKVQDEAGKPIQDARVFAGTRNFVHQMHERRTDEEGRLRLGGGKPGRTFITVYAPGYVPARRSIIVSAGLDPVVFRLGPPHRIHGWVVDRSGKPVPGAWVVPKEWRGLHFSEFKLKTDAEGRFCWDNAPPDRVRFTVVKEGYQRVNKQWLTPSKDGHVIELTRAVVVRGNVVDARTGEPIPRFQVSRSAKRWGVQDRWEMLPKAFGGGRYEIAFEQPGGKYRFRIEADGYQPAVSRDFKPDEGRQVFDFKLQRGKGPTGVVRLPDGSPLAGAPLVLFPLSEFVFVTNAAVKNPGSVSVRSGQDGRYRFRPQDEPFGIVVAHPRGYAERTSEQLAASPDITLEPWGRVEGTLRIAGKPGARLPVSLSWEGLRRKSKLKLDYDAETWTDAKGRFVFPHARPGTSKICRSIMDDKDALASNYAVQVEVESGKTARVELGGTKGSAVGRTVVGRVVAPAGATRKIDWANDRFARLTWEGESARHKGPKRYWFNVGLDGRFRVDDVLPGRYELSVKLYAPREGPAGTWEDTIGKAEHEFTVPAAAGDRDNTPVDLGEVGFKFRRDLEVGQQAPPFDVPVRGNLLLRRHRDNGQRIRIADFVGDPDRGKFVLLAFYSALQPSGKVRLDALRSVHEAFGDDERFVMILLATNVRYEKRLDKPFGRDNPRVLQAALGYVSDKVLEDYGVVEARLAIGDPQVFLIGPDGTVLATDLVGLAIQAAVTTVLGPPKGRGTAAAKPVPKEVTEAIEAFRKEIHSRNEQLAAIDKDIAELERDEKLAAALTTPDARMKKLQKEVAARESELEILRTRYEAIRNLDAGKAASSPELIARIEADPKVTALVRRVRDLTERKAALSTRHGPEHKNVAELDKQLKAAEQELVQLRKARFKKERAALTESYEQAYHCALRAVTELRESLAKATQERLDLDAKLQRHRELTQRREQVEAQRDRYAKVRARYLRLHPQATTRLSDTDRILELRVTNRQTKEPLPDVRFNVVGAKMASARTDQTGRLRIAFDGQRSLSLFISADKPGFVPLVVQWSYGGPDSGGPHPYALAMEPAVPIGGIVRDETGQPIKDVRVELDLRRPDPDAGPNAKIKIWNHRVKTDAAGRWRYDRAPAALDGFTIRLSHPAHVKTELSGADLPPADKLQDRSAVVVLKKKGRGIPIMGTVLDQEGRPIREASVRGHTGAKLFQSGRRDTTTTDADGRFCLFRSKPSDVLIAVQASGYAPDVKRVSVQAGMEPVTFRLGPGHTIRGRVVNKRGEPLPDVMIDVFGWRGYHPVLDLNLTTDSDGRFAWTSAPSDEVEFGFLHKDYTGLNQERLRASDTEQTITLYKPMRVTGKVLDAETGEPVQHFKVLPACDPGDDATGMTAWRLERVAKASAGRFEIEPRISVFVEPFRFRIEAEGYKPFVSRRFTYQDEEVTYDVRLEKAAWLTGTVRLADGGPLAGALVVMSRQDDPVSLRDRKVQSFLAEYRIFKTDADGRFTLPPQETPHNVLVLHEKGFATASTKEPVQLANLRLQPWGRIEGIARIGAKPAAERKVGVTIDEGVGTGAARARHTCTAVTDARGRFVIERVFPGSGWMGYQIGSSGWAWLPTDLGNMSHLAHVEVVSGQTTRVDLGGTGRPIVGRVKLPPGVAAQGKVTWNPSYNWVTPKPPSLPMPEDIKRQGPQKRSAWRKAWLKSKVDLGYEDALRRYAVVVKPDGTFRVDDVTAGIYTLCLRALKRTKGAPFGLGEEIGRLRHEFVVPEISGGRSDEPLDLGTLTLLPPKRLKPGDVAPPFEAEALKGKRIRLADYRGKVVLLHFWCLLEDDGVARLKAVHDAFGADERFVMIGVGFLGDPELVEKEVTSKGITWPQLVTHEAISRLWDDYGVPTMSSSVFEGGVMYLIGPDGKILATGLDGEQIESAVAKALDAQ